MGWAFTPRAWTEAVRPSSLAREGNFNLTHTLGRIFSLGPRLRGDER
jgi:hypothetical protein